MENEKSKDGRLAKQLGDFGESLVMYLLGNLKHYKVALVDHVGADIIATDRSENGKRFAISVKTRWFKKDDPSLPYDLDNQQKLSEFAYEFDMIPVVAFVMIDKTSEIIDVYLMKLSSLKHFAMDEAFNGITVRGESSLTISNAERNQTILQNTKGIDHSRFIRSKFSDTLNI